MTDDEIYTAAVLLNGVEFEEYAEEGEEEVEEAEEEAADAE